MNKKLIILKWIFFSLMIIINAFIIFQSCLPANSSSEWSNVVVVIIEDISGGSVTPSSHVTPDLTFSEFIRKAIGHFTLFGIDGIISYLYFYYLDKDKCFKYNWLKYVLALSIGIFIASLTEIIQLVVPGRYGDIIDVLLDVLGFIFFMGITILVIYLVNRHNSKKKEIA